MNDLCVRWRMRNLTFEHPGHTCINVFPRMERLLEAIQRNDTEVVLNLDAQGNLNVEIKAGEWVIHHRLDRNSINPVTNTANDLLAAYSTLFELLFSLTATVC
jgi:hypothetical protein